MPNFLLRNHGFSWEYSTSNMLLVCVGSSVTTGCICYCSSGSSQGSPYLQKAFRSSQPPLVMDFQSKSRIWKKNVFHSIVLEAVLTSVWPFNQYLRNLISQCAQKTAAACICWAFAFVSGNTHALAPRKCLLFSSLDWPALKFLHLFVQKW